MTAPSVPAAKPAPKPKAIKVRVIYNGIEERLELLETDTLGTLRTQAVAAFPVTEQQHLLSLFDLDGLELIPDHDGQTLAEAGIKNNVRLILRPGVVRGG